MRNLLITLVLSGLIISQTSAQKLKIGIVGGPVMSTTNKATNSYSTTGDSSRDRTVTVKSQVSFFGGVVASMPVGKNIIFKPQLQYIVKGWRVDHDYLNRDDWHTKLVSQWIEMQMNFLYAVPAKNGRFFFGLGPQVSCALSAMLHDSRPGMDKKIEFEKGEMGDNNPQANRFDVGMNLIGEYEFRKGFFISLNYSRGFIDFRNDLDTDINPQNKNIVVSLGIGYMFK
ncbi:MAG TPA: porin family protein [Parafilimonas sp.]|nr:porin family protein [Parafilimonas sp.]